MNFDDTDEKNDYFEHGAPPEPPKEEKAPEPLPEDPDYWEKPESEWEHLKPARSRRFWLWVVLGGVATGVLAAAYVRLFVPYEDDAVAFGYVEHISRRGDIFKTYEGVMLPYKEIRDTTRVYRQDFVFTAADDHVAAELRRSQLQGRPVAVEYVRYRDALPWRGDSPVIVTAVDSIDPASVVPAELLPPLAEPQLP